MRQGWMTLLRERGRHDSGRVGMVELFFDLVFVFAVTQLSHSLLAHLSFDGATHAALLLVAVWRAWIDTSWVTNWLDPERIPVRACLLVLMLAGLFLSASIPEAFGSRGVVFAAAFAFIQVGRTLFFLWAVRNERVGMRRNFQRILVWMSLSAVLWVAGGYAPAESRITWWIAAVLIDQLAPWVYFWVPGLGRSSIADWDVDGGHMAERCALFVIIALGESVLVTGATFAGLQWDNSILAAFGVAVIGIIAMWWIYFDTGAERAQYRIVHASDPGRQARMAYTYLHVVIVAGIIVCAVADEVTLAHPDHATNSAAAAIIGGPMLYLIGNGLFKWSTNDRRGPPLSHLVGVVALVALVPVAVAHAVSAVGLAALTTGALVIAAVWEGIALRRPAAAENAAAAAASIEERRS